MKRSPLVSVIIVNWNGGEVFLQCLRSLQKLEHPNWELIVVDNGSSDDSQKMTEKSNLGYKNFTLIQNTSNLGFAQANNQGWEIANGEYIAFLNNDTEVVPDFIDVLVERMEKEKSLGVIQPKILLMDKKGLLDNAGSFITQIGFFEHWGFMEKDSPEFNEEKYIMSAKGACMLVRREVIEKVGLFDADFVSYFEETDFCWRVWLAGYKVLYFPKTFVYHRLGYTIKRLDVLNLNFHYYKNRICSLIKNLENKNLVLILVPHLIISVGLCLVFLFRKPKNSTLILKSFLWNFTNLVYTLRKRSKAQSLRKIGDDELFAKLMHKTDWAHFFGAFRRVESDIKRKA